MADVGFWWAGNRLAEGEISLAVFGRRPHRESIHRVPLLGSVAAGTVNALLIPSDFGRFLRQHQDATIVCYDAAATHWMLEDYFRRSGDGEPLKILWAYSRESRLIDIMLLDQHVRRCQEDHLPMASPLCRLVHRWTGITLPDDSQLQEQVAAAWKTMAQDPNDSVLESALAVAAGIYRVYEHLLGEAEKIEKTVEEVNRKPPIKPPSLDRERLAEMEQFFATSLRTRKISAASPAEPESAADADQPPSRLFGPLGVGIDVQAAIALRRPDQPALQVDRQQLDVLRRENDLRYQMASRKLHDDACGCFRWEGQGDERLVARDKEGRPQYNAKTFKKWLCGLRDKLCDIHNLPVVIPASDTGDHSSEAELWGIWAKCNRSLRAWRDLERSARLSPYLAQDTPLRSTYEVVPVCRSRQPELVTLRSLRVSVFRPHTGNVFLVCTLPLLNWYCLAAVYTRAWPQRNSRLAGYFLDTEDPVATVAAELYARMAGYSAAEAEAEAKDRFEDERSFAQLRDDFADLKNVHPEKYHHLRQLARVLVETIPLGLSPPLLSDLLEDEYGLPDVKGTEFEWLKNILSEKIVYEIENFVNDDVFLRLVLALGLTYHEGVDLLAEKKHLETTDAALRKDLLGKRKGAPVWQRIEKFRREQPTSSILADDEIVEKVLKLRAWTAARRVIGPTFFSEVRRRQLSYVADEVMKSVAYTLVARGLPLVALEGNQAVLEVAEASATPEMRGEVAGLVVDAVRKILRPFAAGCDCELVALW
jgi:hypothetical protein